MRDSITGRFIKDKSIDNRECHSCGSRQTYIRKSGRPRWYPNRPTNLFLCVRCYDNFIISPKWVPLYKGRKIRFKNKRFLLDKNPRKGICSKCHRKVGDGIKQTHMHHIQYHEDDPLKDTVELCGRCHIAESIRLGAKLGGRRTNHL